jgi:hypothetical protein
MRRLSTIALALCLVCVPGAAQDVLRDLEGLTVRIPVWGLDASGPEIETEAIQAMAEAKLREAEMATGGDPGIDWDDPEGGEVGYLEISVGGMPIEDAEGQVAIWVFDVHLRVHRSVFLGPDVARALGEGGGPELLPRDGSVAATVWTSSAMVYSDPFSDPGGQVRDVVEELLDGFVDVLLDARASGL